MLIPVKKAHNLLYQGKVIGIITDTVYGLAALPSSLEALKEIFRLKKRSSEKTLPLLGHNLMAFSPWVSDKELEKILPLSQAFWPGPLTLVVPALSSYPLLTQDQTIAIRVPNCPPLLTLLQMTGPLAVTSANISGEAPFLTQEAIEKAWGKNFPLFSSPFPLTKTPSTILKIEEKGYSIVRQGAILEREIREKIK